MKLSVGIITFNEERILGKTLSSLRKIADEVVIVDSYSTDRTVEIAKNFGAKVFSEKWKGFGLQKNSVIEKCKGEWILLIDADEELSENLAYKIKELINGKNKFNVYKINFMTIAFGKEIKYGGWSNSYRIRLFKKNSGKYNNNEVHEDFITQEKLGKIREKIRHHSYFDLEDYLKKFNQYTTKAANEIHKKGKKVNNFKTVFSSFFVFIKMYIIRLGFLDGLEGLLLAIMSSNYTFVKYYKSIELKRSEKFGNKRDK